jgi:hypothetical protein
MASYRIFRLKESLRAPFRQLPHVSGVAKVKVKDYEESGNVEAATPYAAWFALKGTEQELAVGDVVAEENGDLRIIKFVGFEPAEWVVPEVKVPGELIAAPPVNGAASL